MPNTGDIVKASDFQAIKPQLSIGTVTTGAAGTNASASITGTSPNFKLNLTIPRGANGTNGQSGVLGTQVFTSSTTVTVPTGATKAILSGCGGGGGISQGYTPSGGHGGAGGTVINYPVSVSAGSSIRITIGTGGNTGVNGANGGAGGITSFGSLLSLGGGGGGYITSSGGYTANTGSTGTSPADISFISVRKNYTGYILVGIPCSYWGYGGYGSGGSTGYRRNSTQYNAPTKGGQGILIVTWAR